MYIFLLANAIFLLNTGVNAKYPNKFPFIDECRPSAQMFCSPDDQKGLCTWLTDQYPICADRNFAQREPPIGKDPGVGLATKFFKFSFGVHLAEGSNQQWIYNVDVEECARRCIVSPLDALRGRIRCLSFDFYPHEEPKTGPPWNETINTGMCVLNSENRDTARLRNEDLGITDAEFFYKSHFTNRPFSDYDGYYEIRDPRGFSMETMLGYDATTPELDLIPVWGKSRWGAYFFEGPIRKDPVTPKDCIDIVTPPDRDPTKFLVGFTPIDDEQHCAGMQTKDEAEALCESAGGSLCTNELVLNQENGLYYRAIDSLFGKKIGCGYDGQQSGPGAGRFPVWAAEDNPWVGQGKDRKLEKKFTRCCAQFGLVKFCPHYTTENINYCAQFKAVSTCNTGVPFGDYGFGNYLQEFRQDCQRFPGQKCSGAVVRDWFTRERCVWCVKPGFGKGGGAGECRPGGDFGICPTSTQKAKNMFNIRVKRACGGPLVICPLTKRFPDLSYLFDTESSGEDNTPTLQPTSQSFNCALLNSKSDCQKQSTCVWRRSKRGVRAKFSCRPAL